MGKSCNETFAELFLLTFPVTAFGQLIHHLIEGVFQLTDLVRSANINWKRYAFLTWRNHGCLQTDQPFANPCKKQNGHHNEEEKNNRHQQTKI
ncbi:hypothetical protein D3C76_1045640 [compost metagenome]